MWREGPSPDDFQGLHRHLRRQPSGKIADRGFGRPLQAIRHGGEEDAAPIRIESLSDHQLEALIARLRKT
jgi:hypothetical protein